MDDVVQTRSHRGARLDRSALDDTGVAPERVRGPRLVCGSCLGLNGEGIRAEVRRTLGPRAKRQDCGVLDRSSQAIAVART